jgi:hypothetical protein
VSFWGWDAEKQADEARVVERGALRAAGAGVPGARCGERRAGDGRQDLDRGRGAAASARSRDGEARPRRSGGNQRGEGGGSRLARQPEDVSLREGVEGPFEITHCIMQRRPCGEGRPCALHDAWVEGQNAILEHLGKRTLADFSS